VASIPRTCPKCRARIDSRRIPSSGKVRCPECGAVVATVRDDEDDRLRSRPVASPPAPAPAKKPSRRFHDDEDEIPIRKKQSSMGPALLIGAGLGLLGLVLCGGGLVAAILYLRPAAADDMPVVAAAVEERGKDPIQPGQGGGELGKLPLQELEAATVYVRVVTPNIGGASGSGFVVRSVGDTAYVVTNHHVIEPLKAEDLPPELRQRFGRGFRRPQPGPVEITAVFRSGTPDEQAVRAYAVADDVADDLAVLRVSGVKDAPRPVDCSRSPKLVRTMPVLTFGFPFGRLLDPDKANPAISVSKGSVTSIRENNRRELTSVQIDGSVNPGNSGGPVVDQTGALIGVVSKGIEGAQIASAVPVHKLNRLMDGRVEPPDTLRAQGTQTEVVARVTDPLNRVRSPAVLYGVAGQVQMPAQGDNGWQPLAGGKSSALKVEGTRGVALLAVAPPDQGELRIIVQVSYVDASGRTVYSEARELRLPVRGAPPQVAGPAGPNKPPPAFNPGNPGQPALPDNGQPLTKDEWPRALEEIKLASHPRRAAGFRRIAATPPEEERRAAVVAELETGLGDRWPDARIAAAKGLAKWGGKKSIPAYARSLEGLDASNFHGEVLEILAGFKDDEATAVIAKRVPNFFDSARAVQALKLLDPPMAEKALLAVLEKAAWNERSAVCKALGDIGGKDSIAPLEKLANDPDVTAIHWREAAKDALMLVKARAAREKK
jgi:S1-C subfamily serine protease